MRDDSLTTDQIVCNLSSNSITKPYFEGVFALDELPNTYLFHRPRLLVCNTAYSKSPGEHWVAFFLTDNSVDYFDSYGSSPSHTALLDFIVKNSTGFPFRYNTRCLQALNATTCGKYCVTYLLYRAMGYTLNQYLDMFTTDPDQIVRKLYRETFAPSNLNGGQICRAKSI